MVVEVAVERGTHGDHGLEVCRALKSVVEAVRIAQVAPLMQGGWRLPDSYSRVYDGTHEDYVVFVGVEEAVDALACIGAIQSMSASNYLEF